eukprot:1620398-Pyramimonas_sp.AAC.2
MRFEVRLSSTPTPPLLGTTAGHGEFAAMGFSYSNPADEKAGPSDDSDDSDDGELMYERVEGTFTGIGFTSATPETQGSGAAKRCKSERGACKHVTQSTDKEAELIMADTIRYDNKDKLDQCDAAC